MQPRVVMVGRFQPFHNGHILVIRHLLKSFRSVILGIGSAQYSHTPDNPFTAGERVEMAVEALRAEKIEDFYAVPIEDINEHGRWVAHVESLVPRFSAAASNNPLVGRLFEERGYRVVSTPLYDRRKFCGTIIRERMLRGRPWKTLVPAPVAKIIEAVGGPERLRRIAAKDE